MPDQFDLDPYDLVTAAVADMIIEGVPVPAMWDISYIAENGEEFFAASQAQIRLQEIVNDYYAIEEGSIIPEDPSYPKGPDGPANVSDL
jgi:hypothetical protein